MLDHLRGAEAEVGVVRRMCDLVVHRIEPIVVGVMPYVVEDAEQRVARGGIKRVGIFMMQLVGRLLDLVHDLGAAGESVWRFAGAPLSSPADSAVPIGQSADCPISCANSSAPGCPLCRTGSIDASGCAGALAACFAGAISTLGACAGCT